MRFEELKNLILLQKEIEMLGGKSENMKNNLEKEVIKHLKEKIKAKDFIINDFEFEIKSDNCGIYEISYVFSFKIDDFLIYGNSNIVCINYKDVEIVKYKHFHEINKAIKCLIKKISEKYKINKFTYDGNINKLYEKLKRKEEKREKIKNILEGLK